MYLSGVRNPAMRADLAAGRIGLLNTPTVAYRIDDTVAVWAMDNGCFAGTYPGDDAYLATLERYSAHQTRCLFVAAPDVVGDADATLGLLEPMARRLRAAGWPVALVGQDGMEKMHVPWQLVDWLFVGGSTEWKMSAGAEALIARAQRHGKRVHVGRVNSATRFRHFRSLGCDTADGTSIAFDPTGRLAEVRRWTSAPAAPFLWAVSR